IFNESFMQDINWINLLKIRASCGVTGNDNLGSSLYGIYEAYNYPVSFSDGAVSYIPYKQTSEDYPDVSWEKTIMKNIGLDFSILGDRISGSFDYFVNDVTDRLGSANTNALHMLGTRPINGSHIQRYGWDATVNTVNIQRPNLHWTSVLTLSHYNAVWKERMPGYDYNNYQIRVDEPVNARYFYRTEGILDSNLSNCPSWQPESHRVPGTAILKDLNGDGTITKEDIDMVNVVPKLYLGFGNTLTWKNWDLDIFLYSQIGINKYNYGWSWANGTSLAGETSNASTMIYHLYNSETNPTGTRQGIGTQLIRASLPENVGTDYGYEDASFVRVRNITLGYNFSSQTLRRLGNIFTGLKIYFDTQNPFTFSKYGPLDPEVNLSPGGKGVGGSNYPMTRQFSLGVKASF
nr:SusC/RagA family TonB-linked outer membrane protein [Bacteroidales bacterium]